MRFVSLPRWLYVSLPYLYVATGLMTILALRNAVAVFSGLLLVSTAAIVWYMRAADRQPAGRRKGES